MARGPSLIPQRVKNTGIDLLLAGLFLGGGILALGYANKRFGILNKLVSGSGSLGFKLGESVGVGLGSIPGGLFKGASEASMQVGGTGKIGTTLEIAIQNLKDNLSVGTASNPLPNAYGETSGNSQKQGGFAELITAIEKNPEATAQLGSASTRNLASGATFRTFTDLFKDIQPATGISSTPKQPLNVANIIQQAGQRLTQSQIRATTQKKTGTQNPQFGGFSSANTQESTLQALIAANAKRYPQYFKVV